MKTKNTVKKLHWLALAATLSLAGAGAPSFAGEGHDHGAAPAVGNANGPQRMADGTFDASQAADLELQPGQMSLHDVYMVHGAEANRSGQRRTGVALRYMPASSHFDRSLKPVDGQSGVPVSFATRPLWLLRGQDVSGRNDFTVGHRR